MINKFLSIALIIFVLIQLFSCKDDQIKKSTFPNYLKNTQWFVESEVLLHSDGEEVYLLSRRTDSATRFNFQAMDFLDDEKFTTYDSWECGNDCFTTVYGRYSFTGTDQVEMQVDSIGQSGTCQSPTRIFKPSKKVIFDISKEKTQLKLTRQ